MEVNDLPMMKAPYDALRHGIAGSLRDTACATHPVELIQRNAQTDANATKRQMARKLYGMGLPMRMEVEKQILGQFGRLPGLPSSRLGLDSLTGELDNFEFDSYVGLPEMSETHRSPDLHSQMEMRLGMAPVTKPTTRNLH